MADITLVHDCDVEHRLVPTALNGDFRDCFMEQAAPLNTHDGGIIWVGVEVVTKGSPNERRGLITYDLKSFIPAGATITAAVWHFYLSATDGYSYKTVRCRRLTWEEDNASWYVYKAPSESGDVESAGVDYLDDADKSWDTDEWVGKNVYIYAGTGAGQYREVTSNTATRLYVTPNWVVNPIANDLYVVGNLWEAGGGAGGVIEDRDTSYIAAITADLTTTGWKTHTLTTLAQDAWNDVNGEDGIVSFIVYRFDAYMNLNGWITFHSKDEGGTGDPYATAHHLRITYTLDSRTFQALVFDRGTAAWPIVYLAGTIAAVGSASGSLELLWALVGSTAGASATAGALQVLYSLAGAIPGTTSVAAALEVLWSLTGTVPATSSVVAALNVLTRLVASASTVSDVSGALSLDWSLVGSIPAGTAIDGDLTVLWSLGGLVAAISTVTGDLILILPKHPIATTQMSDLPLTGELTRSRAYRFHLRK